MKAPYSKTFRSEVIFAWTARIIVGFVLLNVLAYAMRISTELPGRKLMMQFFGLDRENNFPTFFSVLQLLAAGGLALMISRNPSHRSERTPWLVLGAGMIFMSLDEMIQIHELGSRLWDTGLLPNTPWLKFAWVIPGVVVVGAVGISMLGFLKRLPATVSFNLCLSGAIFVSGAIGMEMVGSYCYDRFGDLSYAYMGCVSLEEGMEMLGIAWFIRTSLQYVESTSGRLTMVWPEAAEFATEVSAPPIAVTTSATTSTAPFLAQKV